MEQCDILVIGGGAAGIAAASSAAGKEAAVCLVEAEVALGGVLRQCAHHGFGAGLDGPGYIRMLRQMLPAGVNVQMETTVLALSTARTALLADASGARRSLGFARVILATGACEIPAGALPLAGTRPEGVYTAGEMQARMNLYGEVPEGPVVILGSGDLGLIMAAQLEAEGLSVTLVERGAHAGGLPRNRDCLEATGVRLCCGRTIRELVGTGHLEAVILSDGTMLACRTLLIAVGLRPERVLARPLGDVPWLYLCGNCHRVHAMIESVVAEGAAIGQRAYEDWREER